MTALYQDTMGPSQRIYAYSQEIGSSATWPFSEYPLLYLEACLGPTHQEEAFPSSLTSGPRRVPPSPKITPG